ncbi:MAG: lytic transglycosylase domain-containing protein, partial [Bdellovibrionota bacterium]
MGVWIKFFALMTIQYCVVLSVSSQETESWLIPKTQDFRKRIDFWKRIYSEIPSSEGILHDPNDLTVIYEKIALDGLTHKQVQKKIRERKEYIRRVLIRFAQDGREGLSDEDFQLIQTVSDRPANELRSMCHEVRWQQGLSDRFKEGVQRSYLYLDKIREIFKEEGVPSELAFLPHVESSFNYRAYSKVGAAGIWQFMRSTARLFGLKANYILDERLDPIKAARSAARLLRNDFEQTGSWPLAITSYNHGVHGVVRAINNTGNNDIEDMVKNYNGRR